MNTQQLKKAEKLRELHHSDRILILPNIWDVVGAKLLEKSGLPAIATASASLSFANGFNDGEQIPFDKLLDILKSICDSTDLPVTADIERGYAKDDTELAGNIRKIIHSGVVGINFEDSVKEGEEMVPLDQQCEQIKLIRKVAQQAGVPLVINARCDLYLSKNISGDKAALAIERGNQYKEAGADCFYPILCDPNELSRINSEVGLPINVLAYANQLPMKDLEEIGVARISLGPGLLKAALTKMKEVVNSLTNYEGYDSFTNSSIISSKEVVRMITSDRLEQ